MSRTQLEGGVLWVLDIKWDNIYIPGKMFNISFSTYLFSSFIPSSVPTPMKDHGIITISAWQPHHMRSRKLPKISPLIYHCFSQTFWLSVFCKIDAQMFGDEQINELMKEQMNKLKRLGEYWFRVIRMHQLPTVKTSAQRPERSELKEQKGRFCRWKGFFRGGKREDGSARWYVRVKFPPLSLNTGWADWAGNQ